MLFKLGYSIKQFFRNPKRSLSVMSGIIISITLLSGILIAADGLTNYKLYKGFEGIDFDFMIYNSHVDRDDIIDGLETVKSTVDTLGVINNLYTTCAKVFYNSSYRYPRANIPGGIQIAKSGEEMNASKTEDAVYLLGLDETLLNSPKLKDVFTIEMLNLSKLEDGQILMDNATATEYNLTIGDKIDLHSYYMEWNETLFDWIDYNFTVDAITIVGLFEIWDYQKFYSLFQTYTIFNIDEGPIRTQQYVPPTYRYLLGDFEFQTKVVDNLSYFFEDDYVEEMGYLYFIDLKRERLPLFDTERTLSYLETLKNRIIIESGDVNAYIFDDLSSVIYNVQSQLALFELLSFFVSIPTILLGVLLTLIIFRLVLEQRRREFGQLKSHGASSRQVSKIFLMEAIFVGVVGGFIGLVISVGVSYGLIAQIIGEDFGEYLVLNPLHIDPISIITSIIISVVLILLTTYRPIKKYAEMNVIEIVPHYQEDLASVPKKGKREWIALILGILPIVYTVIQDFLESTSMIMPVIYIFSSLFFTFMPILTWISPFLLIYAIVKIMSTRLIVKFTKLCEKFASIFSRKTSKLVATNITRNPKRALHLIFIISTTICFGIIGQIITASQYQHEFNQVYINVGADMKLDIVYDTNFNYTDFRGKLYNFSADIEEISVSSANVAEGSTISGITARGIDPMSLLNVSELDSVYFYGEDPTRVLTKLNNTKKGVLLSRDWVDYYGFKLGDPLSLKFNLKNNQEQTLVFTIIGLCSRLPGISSSPLFYYEQRYPYGNDVYINFNYLNNTINMYNLSDTTYTYLVDIKDDSTINPITLGNTIRKKFPQEILYVTTFKELYDDFLENRGGIFSAIDLMNFQFPFLLSIAACGILVITNLAIIEKRRELALMRVRGVSKSFLIKSQLGEGLVLLLLGTLIGSVGFFVAWSFNIQLDALDYTIYMYGFTRPFLIPFEMIIFQIILVAIVFLSIMLFSSLWEIRKSNVGRIVDILRTN